MVIRVFTRGWWLSLATIAAASLAGVGAGFLIVALLLWLAVHLR